MQSSRIRASAAQNLAAVFPPLLVLAALTITATAETSKLWGEKGELWDRKGLLRDFTKVGYMEGKESIPDWPVGANVKDFGAKGDGLHDDTRAFRDAIAACPPKHAILVPKGRYRITEQIVLKQEDRSHFVLRGEDMFGSVLFFPLYLAEIHGLPPGRETREKDPRCVGFFRFEGGTHRSFENLSFEFREQPKGNHWEFIGADAIYMSGTEHSWIRNVHMRNVDHGIRLWGKGTRNISVINAVFDQYIDRANRNRAGHIPIMVAGESCLFHNVLLTGKWHHDIVTVQSPKHNVWSRFSGPDMEIDHHSAGSDFGLFTEIRTGVGSTNQYNFLGDNETYWNIQSDLEYSFWKPEARNVVVGIHTTEPTQTGGDFWHENIDPARLKPANLYLAQLDLAGKPRPVDAPLEIPQAHGEVAVLPVTEEGPLAMGEQADQNFRGQPLIARATYQDKKSQKFLLKFDLSGLKRADVPRATLRLRGEKPGTPRVLSVEDDSWRSETVTYRSAPKGSAELDVKPSAVSPGWVDVDLTNLVRSELAGDRVVSVLVEGLPKGNAVKFSQKGHMHQPRLVIEPEETAAYPEPPGGLTVTTTAEGLRIDWDDSSEADVKSYTLYRTPIVDKELPVFAAGLVDSHFIDRLVKPGVEYTYWVTATDTGTRESAPSAKVARSR